MTKEEFEKLIDKDKYQVFVFTSPCSLPVNFIRHPWLVVNKKGIVSRWEVGHILGLPAQKSWGYLYKDFLPPWKGIRLFRYSSHFSNKSRLLSLIEGDKNSEAKRMAELIESSPNIYPYCYKYRLIGPNSNSYVSWMLKQFPELKIELPWNCLGKTVKE